MIDSVFLDLDGPVLDGRLRHYNCYSDILVKKGYQPVVLEQYWSLKRQRCDRRELLRESGAERFYDEFLFQWLELIETKRFLEFDLLQPGALQKIEGLRTAGIKVFLITLRNNASELHCQLESLEVAPLLSSVVAVGTQGGEVAKANAVRAIAEQSKGRSLWIGDTETDVKAARLLDVPICTLSCGLRTEEYLLSLSPDHSFEYLADVDLYKIEGL